MQERVFRGIVTKDCVSLRRRWWQRLGVPVCVDWISLAHDVGGQ